MHSPRAARNPWRGRDVLSLAKAKAEGVMPTLCLTPERARQGSASCQRPSPVRRRTGGRACAAFAGKGPGRQVLAEEVTLLGGPVHPGTVLGPELAAGGGEPGGRPEQHMDHPGVDVLAGRADGQLGAGVAVEVAGGLVPQTVHV